MGEKKQTGTMTNADATIFEELKDSLEDSIAFSRGQISLVTVALPAPPPQPGPTEIVALRKRLRMSQAVFAAVINVSAKTLQSWEQGLRQPSHAALRLLQMIDDDPEVARTIVFGKPASVRQGSDRRPT